MAGESLPYRRAINRNAADAPNIAYYKGMRRIVPIGHPISLSLVAGLLAACLFSPNHSGAGRAFIRHPNDTAALAEQELRLDFLELDSLREVLEISSSDLPEGAEFVVGRFSWTPRWKDIGTHEVHMRVFNKSNPSVTDDFEFQIQVRPFPFLPDLPKAFSLRVGEAAGLGYATHAPADDSLDFSLSPLPAGMQVGRSLPDSNGLYALNWKPDSTQAGSYRLKVTARNHQAPIQIDTGWIQITVSRDAAQK